MSRPAETFIVSREVRRNREGKRKIGIDRGNFLDASGLTKSTYIMVYFLDATLNFLDATPQLFRHHPSTS